MSNYSGHYIEKCSCGAVLSQCRCPGPKTEYISTHPCPHEKRKKAHGEIVALLSCENCGEQMVPEGGRGCIQCGHTGIKVLAVLPPAMTWTREQPTKPGWYWYRSANSDHLQCLHIVQNGSWLGYWYGDNRLFYTLARDAYRDNIGDWAGPIAPPEEP